MASYLWRDNRITPVELGGIVVALILATGAVTLPMFTGMIARHDAWLAGLLGSIVGLLTLMMVVYFDRRFPGQTLPEYSEKLLGPLLARLVLLLYVLYFLHVATLVVRESIDFLKSGFYPAAGPLALGAPLLALTTYLAREGIEVIARTTLIVVPIQVAFSLAVIGAVASQLQPELVLPVLERGVAPVLRGALIPATWFGELIALAFFFSLVRGRRERVTGALAAMGLVVLLLVGLGLSAGMLFGDQVGRLTYPHSSVARFVTIGGFLRIDPLTMSVWLFLTVIKVAVLQYLAVITLSRLLHIHDHRPLALPLAGLILPLSEGLFANKQDVDAWLVSGWPVYGFCMQVVLPALLLAVALVRFGWRGQERETPTQKRRQGTEAPRR